MLRLHRQKKQKGFTLIELLIGMFITLMLAGIVLANFRGLSGRRNLNAARNNLISDIRRMQSQSIASRDVVAGVVASKYGVNLTGVSQPPSTYNTIAYDSNIPATRFTVSSTNLPANIYISGISVTRSGGTTTTATNLEILFSVPYGRLVQTFSGGAASATQEADAVTTITLSTKDNTLTTTFVINGISGSITP